MCVIYTRGNQEKDRNVYPGKASQQSWGIVMYDRNP